MYNSLPSAVIPFLSTLDQEHEAMLQTTIELAEINSGTLNYHGVNKVLSKLQALTKPLAGTEEIIPVEPWEVINNQGQVVRHPLGNALRITKRPNAPLKVFFCAHMDTVFPKEHHFQTIKWLDNKTVNGPGVTDLKGGILVLLKALQALENSPWREQIGWEILFNPDEEIGSPSSAPLINEAAKRAHFGMIYEPCMPDGSFAGQRKGSGNFSVVSSGKAAHAGREHHLGRNAVRALCDFVSAMDDLNGQHPGITFNPAYIHGGGATNVVPDCCVHKFNVRLEQPDDEVWCMQQLHQILDNINQREGITLTLHGGFSRKPKILTPANKKLFTMAQGFGQALGMDINIKPTGGCCDGNNLAAAGIPNIDTLGVQGGAIHSDQEYLLVDSLVPRAKLSAAILLSLAYASSEKQDLTWLTGVQS